MAFSPFPSELNFLTKSQTSVPTALPAIISSLHGFPASDFVWVGSCYALASAAFLPLSGAFAQVCGTSPQP